MYSFVNSLLIVILKNIMYIFNFTLLLCVNIKAVTAIYNDTALLTMN